MPNNYNLVKKLKDDTRKNMEMQAAAASNPYRLFMEDPNEPLVDEEGNPDDPSEDGTRIINDGAKKVCLIFEGPGPVTVLGDDLSLISRQDKKRAILLASVSVPAKSVKLLGAAIVKGIAGDKYTDTVNMNVKGSSLVPILNGVEIPGLIYTRIKGWEHG